MKVFNFEDRSKHISYIGLTPSDDVDLKPIQYAVYTHAYQRANVYINMYKHGVFKELVVDENFFYDKAYEETKGMVIDIITHHIVPSQLAELLKHEFLPKRQQEKLLKNLILTDNDILCFLFEADVQGWLLDVYYYEKHPERYDNKLKFRK